MPRVPITLTPQSVIPRDPRLTFRIPRVTPAAAAVAAVAAVPQTLAAGTDVWYDVFARSCIPYRLYDAIKCADTDNTTFGADDDFDSESDLFPSQGEAGPVASAWWVITVPPDKVAGCWITLDTWLTGGGDPGADYPNDTNLTIWEDEEGDRHWPLHCPEGGARLDFAGLILTAESDDDPDPDDPTRPYTSKITAKHLNAGQTYFIRVDVWNEQNRGQIYRLRVSLTETAP